MAFIEPMHRNKPNITYLLTLPYPDGTLVQTVGFEAPQPDVTTNPNASSSSPKASTNILLDLPEKSLPRRKRLREELEDEVLKLEAKVLEVKHEYYQLKIKLLKRELGEE